MTLSLAQALAEGRIGFDSKVRVFPPGATHVRPSDPHTDVSRLVADWGINRSRSLGAAELTLEFPLTTAENLAGALKRMAVITVETLLLDAEGAWQVYPQGVFYLSSVEKAEGQMPETIEVKALDALWWATLDYYEGKYEPERVDMGAVNLATSDRITWTAPGGYNNWCADRAIQVQVYDTDATADPYSPGTKEYFANKWRPIQSNDKYFPFSVMSGDGQIIFDAAVPASVTGLTLRYTRFKVAADY